MSKITHIYFSFLLRLDNVYFLYSHGSPLIGLSFPPSLLFVSCFCSCDVCKVLVYIDVGSDVFGDTCSILLPTVAQRKTSDCNPS